MMPSYPSFTQPWQADSALAGQPQPQQGTGDHGEVWNPNGGPDGRGAWEPAPQAPPRFQFESGSWAGRGNDIDQFGREIAGTSGAARDVSRYRDLAQPRFGQGPTIDRRLSDQSRDSSVDALVELERTARGEQPSVAERFGTEMGQRAQNAQYSQAASIRGGALNRAAAARNAQMNAAALGAQTRMQNAATRAGEMASARDAMFGLATGQRAQDLGLATSQAGLDTGQRSAGDQRAGFYESMAQDTKNAQLSHELGRTADEANAANAMRGQAAISASAEAERGRQMVSGATGAITGGVAGLATVMNDGGATPPRKSADPWDPSNYSGSDVRTKTEIERFGAPMAAANRSMEPAAYEYKPEFTPAEQRFGEKNVGPMANRMKADPVASTAIIEDPQTGMLAIDKAKGLKLVMGGLASLQKQVDGLERRRA